LGFILVYGIDFKIISDAVRKVSKEETSGVSEKINVPCSQIIINLMKQLLGGIIILS